MKKIINNVENVEKEMLDGMVKSYPQYVKMLDTQRVLVRINKKEDKVALVSGGGSGHEPNCCGYIGEGMLDAVAPGAIYTSPTPLQMLEAIKAASTNKGVLLIITNYTGDIMNFEMAADMARDEGIEVDQVIINDDVAVSNSLYTIGRRGIGGSVFVYKIAGAIAQTGASLQEVKSVTQKAIDNVRSMCVAISPSVNPVTGVASFELQDDEMEVGIGVHGEPGVSRVKLQSADEIVDSLLEKILQDMDYSNSEVALLVNGSGATPLMEQYIVSNHVHDVLNSKGIKVYKTLVGNYFTSMDQQGFSLSLLKLDDQLKELLDANADSIAYKE